MMNNTYSPIRETTQEGTDFYFQEEPTSIWCSCFRFPCFPSTQKEVEANSLLQERGITENRDSWIVKNMKELKEYSELVAGPKWKNLVRKMGKYFNPKRSSAKTTQFQYDSDGYALNFDNGDGVGEDDDGLLHQNGKFNKKRKDEEDENDENGNDNEDPTTQKKARVIWSLELHQKFVAAVNQLGIEKAVPKRILDLMNVDGLTRENVASHLQKYRLYLKRINSNQTQQANIIAALGGRDYVRICSLDELGDFRTLGGSGQYTHAAALSSYSSGGML